MTETLTLMLEQLILEDNPQDDTDYHRAIGRLTEQPIDTPDDKAFTQDEVSQVIEGFKPRARRHNLWSTTTGKQRHAQNNDSYLQ
jgi:hypothetical protein